MNPVDYTLASLAFVAAVVLALSQPVDINNIEEEKKINETSNPLGIPMADDEYPKPYDFKFGMNDGLGMVQYRQETADGSGAVRGSYGYVDPLGVYRNVTYRADANGYTAVVYSNEPGTVNHSGADVVYVVEQPPPEALAQGLSNVTNIQKEENNVVFEASLSSDEQM